MNERRLTESENPDGKAETGPNIPPQKCFTHYVIQMALDQIDALSDCLIAIQASTYEVEKNTITSLAFLIRERAGNISKFMQEMSEEKRAIAPGEPASGETGDKLSSRSQSEPKNLLFEAIVRWYQKEAEKADE